MVEAVAASTTRFGKLLFTARPLPPTPPPPERARASSSSAVLAPDVPLALALLAGSGRGGRRPPATVGLRCAATPDGLGDEESTPAPVERDTDKERSRKRAGGASYGARRHDSTAAADILDGLCAKDAYNAKTPEKRTHTRRER